jgi:hypothetical protein
VSAGLETALGLCDEFGRGIVTGQMVRDLPLAILTRWD